MRSDILKIGNHARKNAGGLIDVVDFTLATIQQQFPTVPNILADWRLNGPTSPMMFGSKRDGWQYIREHNARLFSLMTYLYAREDVEEAIDTMLEVPGLGIVKAAFVCQLFGFNTGCIDTHNAILYDIDVKAFRTTDGMQARTKLAKISAYQALVVGLGGSQPLWERWCHYVGERYSGFADGRHCSRHHVWCVTKQFKLAQENLWTE